MFPTRRPALDLLKSQSQSRLPPRPRPRYPEPPDEMEEDLETAPEVEEEPELESKNKGEGESEVEEGEGKFTPEGAHFIDTASQNCQNCSHLEGNKCELVEVTIPNTTGSWCQFHSSSPIWSKSPTPEKEESEEVPGA